MTSNSTDGAGAVVQNHWSSPKIPFRRLLSETTKTNYLPKSGATPAKRSSAPPFCFVGVLSHANRSSPATC